MTGATSSSAGGIEFVVGGALGLAAHFFPRRGADGKLHIQLDDACFLLSGQVETWSLWPRLSRADQVRIARILRFRPVEVANRNVFVGLVGRLVPGAIAGFRLFGPDQLLVDLGRPPLEFVDECVAVLLRERELKKLRTSPIALTGDYQGPRFLPNSERGTTRVVDVRYRLLIDDQGGHEKPIDIGAPADAETVDVPVLELRHLAARLDAHYDQSHRQRAVNAVFEHLQAAEGGNVTDQWTFRPGPTRIFQAPTGVGKNVLAELLACWCALHGRVASLVVPTNAMVVKTAHSIEFALRALDCDAKVVPLTSPHSAQNVAETAVRGTESNGLGHWAMERLAYGCALPAAAVAEDGVESWEPGEEPCDVLRAVGSPGLVPNRRYACPWKPTCGKYRNARLACSAAVIVTSHLNWLVGTLHIPVQAHSHVDQNIRVEELLLHRSHVVMIDEIDSFQATMIGHSARGLLLAHRRPTPAPLLRLDNELSEAFGRVDTQVEHQVRAAIAQARFLAENYTSHLAEGAFRRIRRSRGSHPMAGRWLLPRKWDGWLAATLFGVPDGQPPEREHYQMLQALFESASADEFRAIPGWLHPVQSALARVTSITTGEDFFQSAWDLIFNALRTCPDPQSRLIDDDVRVGATDRLIRRAYLDGLRTLLFRFVYAAPQLQASGVFSAREIGDALGQYASWRAAPYGPLGRALFAFTEQFDPDRSSDTSLRVSAFGGDPHTYVTSLGDATALAHLGQPRVVMGLSATSFFPGAPHHHVFSRPTWWIPDDRGGGIRLLASPISDQEREFVRVSGTYGQARSDALVKLGELLWKKHLAPALGELVGNPETAHRARFLLATTSYAGARDLAAGISNAGVPATRIVLAVSADDGGPQRSAHWRELPADRLESFGQHSDDLILIAPLARAQRGLNIVDHNGRSLIGSVWLVVRPVPIIDEPAEILAHVHASARSAVAPSPDPAAVLDMVRQVAGRYLEELVTALPYFRTLPEQAQLAIAAETLNGLIQLAGRARRGGAVGEIHLVDYAFIDDRAKSDLPSLIRRLRRQWDMDGNLPLINALYGRTIQEIFHFADSRSVT